ncbi:MAG TPA: CPBP family intramembrane metalloprotease [Saprospiraceae bacterium]|nr:CPBP family intramembrane metalloprotease [Saprospiraceae bacterium]HRG64999.1 CPBP family intramembrane metalloprotease [Saprospiraceae bacterium]
MLQIVALIAVSWLILWLTERGDLSVLGLAPTVQRVKYVAILFSVSAIISGSAYLLKMYFAKEVYVVDGTLTTTGFLIESWYQIRTVLTEELLCRGVILYIMIKKWGQGPAILVSSILFALLHWLNAGVWGNVVPMALVFAFTFAMGLLLAYSYARSNSLLLPFAIHLGWNWMQNYVFPNHPVGNHVFVLDGPPPVVTISYLAFFTMLLLPKIAVLVVNYGIVRSYRS